MGRLQAWRAAGLVVATVMALTAAGEGLAAQAAATKMPPAVERLITAAYVRDGGTATEVNRSFAAANIDESGVYAANGGALTLVNATIATTGGSSSTTEPFASSMWGINSAVFANSDGHVDFHGGSVTTTGYVAGGFFATCGGSLDIAGAAVRTTGDFSHGVDATYGGAADMTEVSVVTTGAHASALATDFGGGRLSAERVTAKTEGQWSAGVYIDWKGAIMATDSVFTAAKSEGGVIAGDGVIKLTNCAVSGGTNALFVHNPITPVTDTSFVPTGVGVISGGSLSATGGAAIMVRDAQAAIAVQDGTVISSAAGIIVEAKGKSKVCFTAKGEVLAGALLADGTSSLEVTLAEASTLTGAINAAALKLDAASTWTVTADSVLTSLSDEGAISGDRVTNIIGNGHNVYYDSSLSANSALGGRSYGLVNGGQLMPR